MQSNIIFLDDTNPISFFFNFQFYNTNIKDHLKDITYYN